MLEEDSDFTLIDLRREAVREPFVERILDRQSHPRPRLGLLSPIQHERPANPL